MQLIPGQRAAATLATIVAKWRLTNPYAQGTTLGREQCMSWD